MAEKTTVPGMNQKSFGTSSNQCGGFNNPNLGPFGMSGANDVPRGGRSRGTVVPGMEEIQECPSNRNQVINNKPIVGFLYSVSRTPFGEYWPIYLGQNVIGRDNSCSIILEEGTVSSEHALIMVRKMKNPEKLIASIVDARSTCGTMINGESLGFDQVECKSMDVITIGENYELLFILIDNVMLNLSTREDFVPVNTGYSPRARQEDVISSFTSSDFDRPFPVDAANSQGKVNTNGNLSSRFSNPANNDRTVVSGGPNPQAGGTVAK